MGRVKDADKLFEKIPERNVVIWSIMVHGYSKNGLHEKSVECFNSMRNIGLVPNSFTIVGVLVGVSGLRDLILGQSVHGLIVKLGLEDNSFVGTSLIEVYATWGKINDSCKIFENLKSQGLVPWNAMISAFVHNGLYKQAFLIFNWSRKSDLLPNSMTVMALTQSCVAMESKCLCESVHAMVVKLGLMSDVQVNNSVLFLYSSLMELPAAWEVFDAMEEKDVISWSTMMSLMVHLEYASDAIKLFFHMRDYDHLILMNLISACGILGNLKMGKSVHAQVLTHGFGSELPLLNATITMYARCEDLNSSRTAFDQSTMKSMVSWTSIISGLLHNGRPKQALDMFIRLRIEENFFVDSVVLVSTLAAASEMVALELCMQLHCHTVKAGFTNYRSIQNCLISTYSKCGNVELANNIFVQMASLRDIVSWNAIINGYGINGHGETALSLFYEFRKSGVPDSATYLSILSACSHSGLVSEGLLLFSHILEENRIRISAEHYGCVADLLARAGYLSDASKFLDGEGKTKTFWKAILNGCVRNGDLNLAEFAVRKFHEQIQKDSGHLVLLSNLYASVGRFKDAEALRLSMEAEKLIKVPGFSILTGNL
ncbi:pentatricopeptide repeat-containing protein At4g13650-like [Lycium ferocissimum]|uniref:pentatricopeptide repeat-containing protein At4g13650-like n=1 Tax=Lycium ferocissimum TaxID=112874 RepID=UPI002815E23D|nr:pentatricopeptide repeat-containing protein At4g13650-like [Lycium ferocissimum]